MSLFGKSHGQQAASKPSLASDAVILFADLQEGISDLPLTVELSQLRKSVRAMAKLAKIFDIPVFVSTVPGQDGSAARVMPEIGEILGTLPAYQRTTPASFANAALAQAVTATGRKTVIISGVASEVAVLFACLSAAELGYTVHVVVDACGGVSPRTEQAAFNRMLAAGVTTTSVPSLAGELAGDFSQPNGQAAIGVLFELAGG